jgi:hypothetical protein
MLPCSTGPFRPCGNLATWQLVSPSCYEKKAQRRSEQALPSYNGRLQTWKHGCFLAMWSYSIPKYLPLKSTVGCQFRKMETSKAETGEEVGPVPMEEDSNGSSEAPPVPSPEPVKRGRGRPPKKHSSAEKQPPAGPDQPKRPRGRPPGEPLMKHV